MEAGDKFVPFGMKGKKKVSDYLTDRKFSFPERKSVCGLLSRPDCMAGRRA